MWSELCRRLAPFVALLDAKYLPLLFAGTPQAYTVYVWLVGSPEWIRVLGALGYEMVYVGAIAWTEHGAFNRWTWLTALAALLFSIAVAIYVYWPGAGWGALLHAGFPLVAFCYTLQMHAAHLKPEVAQPPRGLKRAPTHLVQRAHTMRHTLVQRPALPDTEVGGIEVELSGQVVRRSWRQLSEATGVPVATLRRKVAGE